MSEEYYVGYMEIDEALKTIRRGLAKRFGNSIGDDGPHVVIYPDGDASDLIDRAGFLLSEFDCETARKLSDSTIKITERAHEK